MRSSKPPVARLGSRAAPFLGRGRAGMNAGYVRNLVRQRRLPSPLRPAPQITQINGSDRAAGQSKLSRHTSHRRALTGQPHRLFEALAERRLARQLRHFLRLDPAVRTAHPIQFHHHRRPKLETREISYLSLVGVIGIAELPPTARANQFPVSTFAPNPQLQRFCLLLDFVSVDPIPRPPQYFGPVRLSHPAECNQNSPKSKCPLNQELLQIPAQSPFLRRKVAKVRRSVWNPTCPVIPAFRAAG